MRAQFKTCVRCGKKFCGDYAHGKDAWRKRKYCSTECKKEAQIGILRAPALTKACEVCGRKFHNRRPNGMTVGSDKWAKAKFCSPKCRAASMVGKAPPNKGVYEDPKKRFMRHVQKQNGHWIWTGKQNKAGYGHFQINGKTALAHRISYMLFRGPIPQGEGYHGLCVCHKCDTPECVKPAHLFLGSHYVNMQDREAKGRRFPAHGSQHGMSRLSDDDARTIIEISKTGRYTQKEIAKMFGVSNGMISLIINRKNWTHI